MSSETQTKVGGAVVYLQLHCNIDTTQENNSFVLRGVKDVLFEDRPIPKLNGPRDVLLQVNFTGICGSDVHYWQHGRIGHFVVKDPMVLGHESAGTVLEVGSAVKSVKKGDRVAMEPGIPCRHCVRCKEGKYNLCPDMAFAATPPYDGTLAKYYVLPEDFCYKLPENMSLEEGALMEPLAVGVHITKQSGIKHGDTVVVFGAGPVGLLCCAVAKALGASKVIAVDINTERLDFAKSFAATSTFVPSKVSAAENAQKIKDDNDLPSGADVAIDASGVEPSVQTAIHVLRMGGSYVQGGMGRDEMTFPIMAACTKELTVRGSFRYGPGDYAMAVDLTSSGKVDVKKLISRKVNFEDAEQAFEDVKAGKAIKVLIEGPK
ncbi:D-xylulose reductase A [Cladophialophora yegresii CBS 114405]|uniref:D-xylulose reductase n=1 Tax=Cladophialophora yegresii CBS 114405 TaxID=1182544 RepID=W9WAD5_9EURO|nr:D-xylulose reductase A [Cladophialophora yegresii CBS 114405]EXJ61945.1 D-xylulose reductase A [Cladophialophora yegresii CBS 114405]